MMKRPAPDDYVDDDDDGMNGHADDGLPHSLLPADLGGETAARETVSVCPCSGAHTLQHQYSTPAQCHNRLVFRSVLELGTVDDYKSRILNETKNVSSFVVIGQTLHKLYYEDKLMKTQREFLEWTKANLGFSKSTTYEYIISYRVYSEIASKITKEFRPPMYQSHCQLLSKVPENRRVDIWMDVCRQAANGVVTTAFLENYLDRHNLRSTKGGGGGRSASTLDSGGGGGGMPGLLHTRSDISAVPSVAAVDRLEEVAHDDDQDEAYGDDVATPSDAAYYGSQPHTGGGTRSPHELEVGHHHHFAAAAAAAAGRHPTATATTAWSLPVDEDAVFQVARRVVAGGEFDLVLGSVDGFRAHEHTSWHGRVWVNLTPVRAMTTAGSYASPAATCASSLAAAAAAFTSSAASSTTASPAADAAARTPNGAPIPTAGYEGGLEHMLRVVFTKFAAREFVEGLFLLRAEFGADWFTPILQHPHCVLRHTRPPAAVPAPPAPPQLHQHLQQLYAPPRPAAGVGVGAKRYRRAAAAAAVPALSVAPAAPVGPPPFETFVMFYLGPHIKEFCHYFRRVGLVPGINSWSAIALTNPSLAAAAAAAPASASGAPTPELRQAASALSSSSTSSSASSLSSPSASQSRATDCDGGGSQPLPPLAPSTAAATAAADGEASPSGAAAGADPSPLPPQPPQPPPVPAVSSRREGLRNARSAGAGADGGSR
ncbi:hypothetical protein HK405_009969, partial [Cladochytrium tenue]